MAGHLLSDMLTSATLGIFEMQTQFVVSDVSPLLSAPAGQ
jgi:hypothetical protein